MNGARAHTHRHVYTHARTHTHTHTHKHTHTHLSRLVSPSERACPCARVPHSQQQPQRCLLCCPAPRHTPSQAHGRQKPCSARARSRPFPVTQCSLKRGLPLLDERRDHQSGGGRTLQDAGASVSREKGPGGDDEGKRRRHRRTSRPSHGLKS